MIPVDWHFKWLQRDIGELKVNSECYFNTIDAGDNHIFADCVTVTAYYFYTVAQFKEILELDHIAAFTFFSCFQLQLDKRYSAKWWLTIIKDWTEDAYLEKRKIACNWSQQLYLLKHGRQVLAIWRFQYLIMNVINNTSCWCKNREKLSQVSSLEEVIIKELT